MVSINKKIKIKTGFSIVELMAALSITVILGLVLGFGIQKKAQKTLSEAIGGRFSCYKDIEGNLHQRVEINFRSTTRVEDNVVDRCNYTFPANARRARMYLIGGGGGGGGVNDITCTEETIANTLITPFTCSGTFYYNGLVSGYADCYSTVGNVSGVVNGIEENGSGLTFAQPICNLNNNIAAQYGKEPSSLPNTVSNGANTYFDDNGFKKYILTNYRLSVKGGDRDTNSFCTFTLSANIGDRYICYNGVSSRREDISGETVCVSPTPGIIKIGSNTYKAPGDAWECKGSQMESGTYGKAGNYGNISSTPSVTCSNAETTSNVSYSGVKITACNIPHGKGGSAGATLTVDIGNTFASREITIERADIGTGGTKGAIGTGGGNGGKTNFDGREANGGLGGEAGTNNRNLRSDFTRIAENGRENPNFTINSNYNGNGTVGDYITNRILPPLSPAHRLTYEGKTGLCTEDGANSSCTDAQNPNELSFGTGGGGANSVLVYDPLKEFKLTKDGAETNFGHDHRLIKGESGAGMGGAVVIEWGEIAE